MKRILLSTVAAAALLGFSGSAMATDYYRDNGFVSDWDWYKIVLEKNIINFDINGSFDPSGMTQVWVDQTFIGSVSAEGYILGDFSTSECSFCGYKTVLGQIEQTVSAAGVVLSVESQVPIFAYVDQSLFGDVSAVGVVGFPADAIVEQTVSAVGVVASLENLTDSDAYCGDCEAGRPDGSMFSDLIINADISQFACADVSAYGKLFVDTNNAFAPYDVENITKQTVTAAGLVTSIVNQVAP